MSLLRRSGIIIISAYLILFFLDIDDQVFSKFTNIINEIKGVKNLSLENYKVTIEAKEVDGVADNLSGITYSPNTKTLFAIQNKPRKIYELSLTGDLIRTINLHGFKDTEGISFMYDKFFSIVDEKLKEVFILKIDSETNEINRKDIKYKLKLDNDSPKNFSYEGIAYNKNKDEFYIVNEKFPVQTITISNWISKKDISMELENGFSSATYFVSDLSGIHYNENIDHVMLLSDESMLLTEVDLNGNRLSFMDLEKGFNGLTKDIPQAEGITMDADNNVYIVSEPNLFYKFSTNN